jgi:hypothetical protein
MIVINSGQVSIPANSEAQIVPSRTTRTELRLRGSALNNLFLGPTSSVSITTGYNPQAGTTAGVSEYGALEYVLPIAGALYGFNGNSSAITVPFLEIYDDGT